MDRGRFLSIVSSLFLLVIVTLGLVFIISPGSAPKGVFGLVTVSDSPDDLVAGFGECALVGDNIPCDSVSLSEVVSLINQWARGGATLRDVVRLINAWADSSARTTTTTVSTTTTTIPSDSLHPYLLFHEIEETPGYQNRLAEPWKGWENTIKAAAIASLSRDFSSNLGFYDSVTYRASFARDLGMAYQITKNNTYAGKAREALLNLDVGTLASDSYMAASRARALGDYCLAYDWVQPTLSSSTDEVIRDKLALLADAVYKNITVDISPTQQGQVYPLLGVASAALYDYGNPNHLTLSSTPAQWHRVGREYLLENDSIHYWSLNKPLLSRMFDEVSGKFLNGAYKIYVMDECALWFQVSNNFYDENLLETYPTAKKEFTSEIWESMPNHYSDNYVTNGNTKWVYHKAIVSLLPDDEKSEVLNHLDRIENSNPLPYSGISAGGFQGGISSAVFYSVFGNYSSIPRTYPANTSHMDANAITQLIRGNWSDDSDWLSIVTFNKYTGSNRDTQHHDQLAFEYYSRGDLLLADGGEEKYILDMFYGTAVTSHNTISIEDPRSQFPASFYTGSSSLGIYKGDSGLLHTPPTVDNIVQVPWMQLVQTHVAIKNLSLDTYAYAKQSLSSPINYSRAVLYPNSDYFIITDRMEGSESWIYRNLFRPTSLNIIPTYQYANSSQINMNSTNKSITYRVTTNTWNGSSFELLLQVSTLSIPGNVSAYVNGNYVGNFSVLEPNSYYYITNLPSTLLVHGGNMVNFTTTDNLDFKVIYAEITIVGNVKGNLSIGNNSFDWVALNYTKETQTGINTSSVRWNATNPYGQGVRFEIFSAPKSEILVTKHIGRIAGYGIQSEVFNPIVWLRTPSQNNLYRLTALLSRYPAEEEKSASTVTVNGTGNALRVTSSEIDDFIYTGRGSSSFGNFSTDADTLYYRTTPQTSFTLLNGSYVNYIDPVLSLSLRADYFTLKEDFGEIDFEIKSSGSVDITIYDVGSVSSVTMDGSTHSDWHMSGSDIVVTSPAGEHYFELNT
jgi:hypothetical protein